MITQQLALDTYDWYHSFFLKTSIQIPAESEVEKPK